MAKYALIGTLPDDEYKTPVLLHLSDFDIIKYSDDEWDVQFKRDDGSGLEWKSVSECAFEGGGVQMTSDTLIDVLNKLDDSMWETTE